jgi:hypothetical protein
MADTGEGRELLLELRHLRAEDELAVMQHGIHAAADVAFQPGALALKIEERDARVFGDGKRGA